MEECKESKVPLLLVNVVEEISVTVMEELGEWIVY